MQASTLRQLEKFKSLKRKFYHEFLKEKGGELFGTPPLVVDGKLTGGIPPSTEKYSQIWEVFNKYRGRTFI